MRRFSRSNNNKGRDKFTKGKQKTKFQSFDQEPNYQKQTKDFSRFKFFIEYERTRFSGCQRQEKAWMISLLL